MEMQFAPESKQVWHLHENKMSFFINPYLTWILEDVRSSTQTPPPTPLDFDVTGKVQQLPGM